VATVCLLSHPGFAGETAKTVAAAGDETDTPIALDLKSMRPEGKIVAGTLGKKKPLMIRDVEIEAPLKLVDYFVSRFDLAYRIMDENSIAPFALDREDDGAGWEMAGTGKEYTFSLLGGSLGTTVLEFSFYYKPPIGIGVKMTGSGMVVFRLKKGESKPLTLVDYDIYFIAGSTPVDRLTKKAPFIQTSIIGDDINSVLRSFIELCEGVYEDPETVADEMEMSDDVFTEAEVRELRDSFIQGRHSR